MSINPSLKDLQQAWQQALLQENSMTLLQDTVSQQGSLTGTERIAIYQNLYQTNLIACLASTYSVVAQLVGQDCFQQMAKQYIKTFPSRSPNLNDYGDNFPEFINTIAEVGSLPYLSDIARLEWLYLQCQNEEAAIAVSWEATAELFAQFGLGLCFKLQPHVRLLQSHYPIDDIWHWHQQHQQETLTLSNESVQILLSKPTHQVEMTRLKASWFAWVSVFAHGKTLSELINQHPELDNTELVALLQTGLQQNWLECVNIDDDCLEKDKLVE